MVPLFNSLRSICLKNINKVNIKWWYSRKCSRMSYKIKVEKNIKDLKVNWHFKNFLDPITLFENKQLSCVLAKFVLTLFNIAQFSSNILSPFTRSKSFVRNFTINNTREEMTRNQGKYLFEPVSGFPPPVRDSLQRRCVTLSLEIWYACLILFC